MRSGRKTAGLYKPVFGPWKVINNPGPGSQVGGKSYVIAVTNTPYSYVIAVTKVCDMGDSLSYENRGSRITVEYND
jgi:hypothetical protein